MWAAVRADPYRISWPKNANHRTVQRHGQMHWAGIISDVEHGAGKQRGKFTERRHPGKIDHAGGEICYRFANNPFSLRTDQNHCKAPSHEVSCNLGELADSPMFGLPNRARSHDHKVRAINAVLA